jgi:ketosteroid isomerase-like protein
LAPEQKNPAAKGEALNNPNLKAKDELMAALGRGDKAAIAAGLHPDFEVHQAAGHPYGGLYRSPQGFLDMLDRMQASYQLEEVAETNVFVAEDPNHIALEFALRGKVIATGKPFQSTVIEHWSYRDGKLVKIVPHWFEIP